MIGAIDLGTGLFKISSIKGLRSGTCVFFVNGSMQCFGYGAHGAIGGSNKNDVGDGPGEMGSNLPFINIFPPTQSPTNAPTPPTSPTTNKPTTNTPTKAPTAPCGYDTKKACSKNKLCEWKKNKCSVFDCSKFALQIDCIAKSLCTWKKSKCLFVNCLIFMTKKACTANLQYLWKNVCSFK